MGQSPGMKCTSIFSDASSLIDSLKNISLNNIPNAILLDINLPDRSGIDCLPVIKSNLPEVSVIVLTMAEDDNLIFKALKNGADGYITKDSSSDFILDAIRHTKEGSTLMPADIAEKVFGYFSNKDNGKNRYQLTGREAEVLEWMSYGHNQKQIAAKMTLSHYTINSHTQNIYAKLQVNSGIEAVAKALREDII